MDKEKNLIAFREYLLQLMEECMHFHNASFDAHYGSNIHGMRVSIKQVKAISGVLKFSGDKESLHKIKNKLKNLYRLSGKIRDIRNVMHTLKTCTPNSFEICYDPLHSNLTLYKKIWKKNANDFKRDLIKIKNTIIKIRYEPSENDFKKYLKSLSKKVRLLLKADISTSMLHPLRKMLKKWQFISNSPHLIPTPNSDLYKSLHKAQLCIGQWHDIFVTINYMKKLKLLKTFPDTDRKALKNAERQLRHEALAQLKKLNY